MAYEHQSSSGAAPARARSSEPVDGAPEEASPHREGFLRPEASSHDMDSRGREAVSPDSSPPQSPLPPHLQELRDFPLSHPTGPSYRLGISDDLNVPWGWMEVALLAILWVVASFVVTYAAGEIAVQFLGVRPTEIFGETFSTAKSIVVLLSQAVVDFGAILFLYAMLAARTSAPFWPSIGWRDVRPGEGKIRDRAVQFLAGGAVLAVVVSVAGAFFNSKATLPIEQLLQSRASIVLFGLMGVLVAPLVEETLFRGFLYPVVARWLGVGAGIIITGTIFGLMHSAQLWGGWGQIALLIFVGVVLTWVRARTGTVAASYFVHLGYNGLQLAGYLVYVIGHK